MSNLPALTVLNLPSVYGIKNKSPLKEYSVQGNLAKLFYVRTNFLVTEREGCELGSDSLSPTYPGHSRRHGLGHLCGICEDSSLNYNLSQAFTVAGLPAKLSWFNFSGRPAAVHDCRH